jgi:ribonuclease VapC
MFVDASALLAFLLQEPESDALADRLEAAGTAMTSSVALYETVAALMSRERIGRNEAEARLLATMDEANISVIDITPEIGRLALDAFDRYGKGRGHPAQLNMGDCFAYACAKAHGVPLLYKGDDFARTDLG